MNVAVVIPIYKPSRAELKWYETISLARCVEVLGHYPIVFVAPSDRQFDYLPSEIVYRVETFDPKYFRSRDGYNVLMMSPQFYERFLEFDFILICQLDAFVFSDRLEEFCELGYDYIGAPWLRSFPFAFTTGRASIFSAAGGLVGNGGFSLRNVRAHKTLLTKHGDFVRLVSRVNLAEDVLLSYLGKIDPSRFKIAPIRTASQFSVEHLPERWIRRNANVLPFGCHGWHQYSPDFYVRSFSECGIDLTPFRHLMLALDPPELERNLRLSVMRRLINRLKNNRPLRKYLPPNEKFFVMIADDRAKILAQKLFAEGLPIVNTNGIPLLINDDQLRSTCETLNRIDVRGLLLSVVDDSALVERLIGAGAENGRHFISFWQEYMKSSTVLLRKISRPSIQRLKNLGIFH